MKERGEDERRLPARTGKLVDGVQKRYLSPVPDDVHVHVQICLREKRPPRNSAASAAPTWSTSTGSLLQLGWDVTSKYSVASSTFRYLRPLPNPGEVDYKGEGLGLLTSSSSLQDWPSHFRARIGVRRIL